MKAYGLGEGGLPQGEEERFEQIGEQISMLERRAMEAERETIDRYVAAFLADQVGQLVECRITGVQPFGFFAAVKDLGGDGLMLAKDLGQEYFRYDETARALVGDETGETYRIGQRRRCALQEANPVSGSSASSFRREHAWRDRASKARSERGRGRPPNIRHSNRKPADFRYVRAQRGMNGEAVPLVRLQALLQSWGCCDCRSVRMADLVLRALLPRPGLNIWPSLRPLRQGAPRMARTLGCFSCHGEGPWQQDVRQPNDGTVWAPNLTQVASHATNSSRAIRQGISDEGTPLIVMPSEVYQHLSDQEVAALIAMIRTLPRNVSSTPANSYGPIGRLGIATGKFKTAPELVAEYATQEPIPVGAQYEGGRRLAVLNCSGCHGPSLGGQEAEPGEISPNLTIAGAYDLPAFTKLLRTGVPVGGQKLNMMGPTARSDLSHLTDPEIEQLFNYRRRGRRSGAANQRRNFPRRGVLGRRGDAPWLTR